MVVSKGAGMVCSRWFGCQNFISVVMAWYNGVSPGYLTWWAKLVRSRACTFDQSQ